jgi:hypothetical protein
MTSSTTPRRRRSGDPRPDLVAAVAGLAAVLAPASLTGMPVVDAIERAIFAAGVAYLGGHARRLTWLIAGAAVTVIARGPALLIALASLAVVTAAMVPERRRRILGAAAMGGLANALLWLPEGTPMPWILFGLAGLVPAIATGLPFVRSPRRTVARAALWGIGGLALLATVLAGAAMLLAYGQVRDGASDAQRALDAARDGDADVATVALNRSGSSFEGASDRLAGPLTAPARLVPGLAQQVDAVRVTVEQGRQITESADALITTADYGNLQYDGQLDLEQVRALTPPTVAVADDLEQARAELADVEGTWLLPPLRSRVVDLRERIDDASDEADLAATLLQVVPDLFGGDGTRRYLIIFITPAELRGAGGFIGSYAELTAIDGDVELSRSGRIADLIFAVPRGQRTISGPEDYLQRYGRFEPQDFLQDVTFSPHFPSSAQVIAELYPQSGGQPVDGVISVDPTGLAALLDLTGPVAVEGLGEPLTAKNAVQVLTKDQYLDLPDEAQRGEILTEATRVTFEALVSESLPAPRRLADALGPAARAGHLRLWSPTEDEQAAFERLRATGELAIGAGHDGFSVVQQNTGNNKIDAYLQRAITYEPTIDAATGELTASLRVVLRNEVPSVDLPDPVVGNSRGAPVGTNVTWLTIFTPHLVTEATLDGAPISLGPSRERDLNGWNTPLLSIPPGGEVVLEVQLAGGVDLRGGYTIDVLPQPVANPDEIEVTTRFVGADSRARTWIDGPMVEPTTQTVALPGR